MDSILDERRTICDEAKEPGRRPEVYVVRNKLVPHFSLFLLLGRSLSYIKIEGNVW